MCEKILSGNASAKPKHNKHKPTQHRILQSPKMYLLILQPGEKGETDVKQSYLSSTYLTFFEFRAIRM